MISPIIRRWASGETVDAEALYLALREATNQLARDLGKLTAECERDELKEQLEELTKKRTADMEFVQGCVAMELGLLKAERDELKAQLAEANSEIDLNAELMRKQNAACAEMRYLLDHWSRSAEEEYLLPLKDATDKLLASSSAGKDLLEQFRKAEGLLREFDSLSRVRLDRRSDDYPDDDIAGLGEAWEELRVAIDAHLKGAGTE